MTAYRVAEPRVPQSALCVFVMTKELRIEWRGVIIRPRNGGNRQVSTSTRRGDSPGIGVMRSRAGHKESICFFRDFVRDCIRVHSVAADYPGFAPLFCANIPDGDKDRHVARWGATLASE